MSYTKHSVHIKITKSMKQKCFSCVFNEKKSQLAQCQSNICDIADELHVITFTSLEHAVQMSCIEDLLNELHQADND